MVRMIQDWEVKLFTSKKKQRMQEEIAHLDAFLHFSWLHTAFVLNSFISFSFFHQPQLTEWSWWWLLSGIPVTTLLFIIPLAAVKTDGFIVPVPLSISILFQEVSSSTACCNSSYPEIFKQEIM